MIYNYVDDSNIYLINVERYTYQRQKMNKN